MVLNKIKNSRSLLYSQSIMNYLWGNTITEERAANLKKVTENNTDVPIKSVVPEPPYLPPQTTLAELAKKNVVQYRKNRNIVIKKLIDLNYTRIYNAVIERSKKGLITLDILLFGECSPENTIEEIKPHFEGIKQLHRNEKKKISQEIKNRFQANNLKIDIGNNYRIHIEWPDPDTEYKWVPQKQGKTPDEGNVYTQKSRVVKK